MPIWMQHENTSIIKYKNGSIFKIINATGFTTNEEQMKDGSMCSRGHVSAMLENSGCPVVISTVLSIALRFYPILQERTHGPSRGNLFAFHVDGSFDCPPSNFKRVRTDSKGPFWERDAVDKDTLPFLSSFKYHGEGHRMESTFISITRCYGGELIAHLLMTGQANA